MLNFLSKKEESTHKLVVNGELRRLQSRYEDRGITIKKLNDMQRKQNEKIKRQREVIRSLKQELFSVRVGMENLRDMLKEQRK